MKTILLPLTLMALLLPQLNAQDAALRERVDKLYGNVQDLIAANIELQKRVSDLSKELEALKQKSTQPADAVTRDELRTYAQKLQEVDQKREADKKLIVNQIEDLAKAVRRAPAAPPSAGSGGRVQQGYEYVIQDGDTLTAIVQAYRDDGIKVTVDDILKANPGLKPTALQIGQKVFVPAPAN